MFKQMLCLILIALGSSTAFAEVCATQSHGVIFQSDEIEVDAATNQVLSQCRMNAVTSNTECSQNLYCGHQARHLFPSGQIACTTTSHNVGFQQYGEPRNVNDIVSFVMSLMRRK